VSAIKNSMIEAFICTSCGGTGEQYDCGPPCPGCHGLGAIPVDAVPTEHHHQFTETTWVSTLPQPEPILTPHLFPEGVEHDLPF